MKNRAVFVLVAMSFLFFFLAGCSFYGNGHPPEGCTGLADCNPDQDCGTLVMCVDGKCDPSMTVEVSCDDDECEDDSDCAGCSLCQDMGGRKTCVGIGVYECMNDADCTEGQVCTSYLPDLPECGGTCEARPGSYVLHEWGVNTPRFDGSAALRGGPPRYWGAVDAKPVLYVYADGPMTIDVGVRFASGGATETWPELPNGQSISWNDVAVTQGECNTTPTPQPDWVWDPPEDREVFQLPEWVVPGADCLTHGDTVSRLLFYTGELADYQPPISGRVDFDMDGDEQIHFELQNTGSAPIGPMLLLYRDVAASDCMEPSYCSVTEAYLAWGRVERLGPGESASYPVQLVHLVSGQEWESVELPPGWIGMADDLKDMLAGAGLYHDEIEVFMGAWWGMFFGLFSADSQFYMPGYQDGAFVLYLWPESQATQNTPLLLSPPPRELARAIVEHQQIAASQVRSGTVRGTVMLDVCGSMPGEDPVDPIPAPGATATAWQDGSAVAQAVSDEEGRFDLVLAEGTYDFSAERNEGEVGDLVEGVEVRAGQEVEVILLLRPMDVGWKPNLYLYPQQTTDVDVTLGLCHGCELIDSEPEYGHGWHVSVEPGGLIDGRYGYLFYEAQIPRRYPLTSGWSVPAAELSSFFEQTLDAYGLNQTERDDFVDYWSEHLAPAPYYGVYPLVEAAVLDGLVGLRISPAPDTLFRLWFVITFEDGPASLPEPEISPVVRQGFTAVEWGVILR